MRKAIRKTDSKLTYERNVCIFINLTTNNIFRLYKELILKIPEHLFYRLIFILQKK